MEEIRKEMNLDFYGTMKLVNIVRSLVKEKRFVVLWEGRGGNLLGGIWGAVFFFFFYQIDEIILTKHNNKT